MFQLPVRLFLTQYYMSSKRYKPCFKYYLMLNGIDKLISCELWEFSWLLEFLWLWEFVGVVGVVGVCGGCGSLEFKLPMTCESLLWPEEDTSHVLNII